MQLVQHGGVESYVVESFVAKDIGAPFKVVLNDAVQVTFDKATGAVVDYVIPDLDALLCEIVLSRVLHPRKLNGAEIKFVRKALGLKQKDLAEKIELAAETLSRIEAGAQPLSPGNEKLLRIYAVKTVFKMDKVKACEAKTRFDDAIDRLFDLLKPRAAFDVADELVFNFHRVRQESVSHSGGASNDNDGYWLDDEKREAS